MSDAREREREAWAVLEEARKRHDEASEVWRKADAEARKEAQAAFTAAPTPDALTFAAYDRCPCGAGLAYVKHGTDRVWDCSAILLGRAIPAGQPGSVQHTDRLPFAFWSVKVEIPGVATTRPDASVPADAGRNGGA